MTPWTRGRRGRRQPRPGRHIVALAAVVIALVGCSSGGGDTSAQTGFVSGDPGSTFLQPEDREPAPDLTGELLGGGRYSLEETRGTDIVVINVWGSWCAPCRAEAPALEEVYQEVKGRGVQFLGINTRDQDAQALAFVKQFGVTYPSLVDRGGTLQAGFAGSLPVAGIPTTLIIDRQGRVAARTLSAVTYSNLLELLQPVLDETVGTARER